MSSTRSVLRVARPSFALAAFFLLGACGETHEAMDAGTEIQFDAAFPDTGPDSGRLSQVGTECSGDMECDEAVGLCITELPGGYCSADCSAGDECPAGSACVQVGRSQFICLDSCDPTGTDECRTGYGCSGGMQSVCLPGCEDDSDCDSGEVCFAESGQAGACFAPDAELGGACEDAAECPGDANCLPERFGFPGGYCASFGCNPDTNTGCPGDAQCLPSQFGGICFDGCSTDGDCAREGYACEAPDGLPDRLVCLATFDPDDLGQACSQGQVFCSQGFCLSEADTGFPGSYCVAVDCTVGGDDCPNDGVCVEAGEGTVCLDGCAAATDCREGYDCRPSVADMPESATACLPGCDMGFSCANDGFVCNTGTGLCTEPFNASQLGEPCSEGTPEDCTGGRCVTADEGFPGGMCTYPGCRLNDSEGPNTACPADSVCVDDGGGDPDLGVCVPSCAAVDDCRSGYECRAASPTTPDGPTGCQPPATT